MRGRRVDFHFTRMVDDLLCVVTVFIALLLFLFLFFFFLFLFLFFLRFVIALIFVTITGSCGIIPLPWFAYCLFVSFCYRHVTYI